MKKRLICGLAAALSLVNLTACGSPQGGKTENVDSASLEIQTDTPPIDFGESVTGEPSPPVGKAIEPSMIALKAEQSASTKYGRHAGSSFAHFVTDGQFYYYIENSEEFFYGGIIKQSIQDGSKSFLYQGIPWELMLGGTQFDNLNLMDGWLYFTCEEYRGGEDAFASIYRIRTDGTELSLLYESQCWLMGEIRAMLVVDGKIYFTPQFERGKQPILMSINLDGSEPKTLLQNIFFRPILDSVVSINVYDRQLLLKNSYNADSIISYDIDSGEKSIIKIENLPAHSAGFLQVSSEGHIYINMEKESSLYYFTLKDANAKKFDSDYGYYTVIEDKLLYYNGDDGNIYIRSLADKDTLTKITDKKVSKEFSYHNGWIFTHDAKNYQESLFYPVPGVTKTTEATTERSFFDVPLNAWYADPVGWAVEKNITNGTSTTTFSPDQDCTQAQILTFLYRADRGQGKAEAADMDKAVAWARQKGMIGASFDGSKPCTRAEAVNYIWQAFNKPSAKASSFTDVPANAVYAKAVSWAVEKGVTNGTNTAQTQFSPDTVCNRGTIVTFLYRAYKN